MLRSTFRKWAYLTFVLTIFMLGILVAMITCLGSISKLNESLPVLFACLFLAFVFVWLLRGELRNKAVVVTIYTNRIDVRYLMGLGKTRTFLFSELDGYLTSWLSSDAGQYEYLYLVCQGKKIIKLSQFYHKNYAELKEAITPRIKDLGEEKFTYKNELKEVFK